MMAPLSARLSSFGLVEPDGTALPAQNERGAEHRAPSPPPTNSPVLIFSSVLHTALFRIWPHLLALGAWSTMICLVNEKTKAKLVVSPVLLTVLGTILGLVLAYRTSTAYERYWEGRRLWSSMVVQARCFSRLVWFHCPDSQHLPGALPLPPKPAATHVKASSNLSTDSAAESQRIDRQWHDQVEAIKRDDRRKAKAEKKTVIGLTLAFAVAVKHYLRGEDGVSSFYEDLFPLVRFLPGYNVVRAPRDSFASKQEQGASSSTDVGGTPETTVGLNRLTGRTEQVPFSPLTPVRSNGQPYLAPARLPPRNHWSDTFPISLLPWAKRKRATRRKVERSRADFERKRKELTAGGHSIPLEITMYMSSYVGAIQLRKLIDVPTANALIACVNNFTDILGSLERILTSPLPFSYSAHIWVVAWIYCLLLPFQIWEQFRYVTIPATMATTFILVGLISLGEEIENPFGYDKNDLALDFFCEHIIKPELDAVMNKHELPLEDWIMNEDNAVVMHGSLEKATRIPEKQRSEASFK